MIQFQFVAYTFGRTSHVNVFICKQQMTVHACWIGITLLKRVEPTWELLYIKILIALLYYYFIQQPLYSKIHVTKALNCILGSGKRKKRYRASGYVTFATSENFCFHLSTPKQQQQQNVFD